MSHFPPIFQIVRDQRVCISQIRWYFVVLLCCWAGPGAGMRRSSQAGETGHRSRMRAGNPGLAYVTDVSRNSLETRKLRTRGGLMYGGDTRQCNNVCLALPALRESLASVHNMRIPG